MAGPATLDVEISPTTEEPSPARWGRACVAGVILWNMWQLRATLNPVAYLNDSAMHESMVRFAEQAIAGWHLPMTQWYPYLNLGSPHLLHYQSFAASLAGLAGTIFSPNAVFVWSLYLLLVLWPIVVYRSARVFGLPENACLAATLLSPFIISTKLVGYEQKAYVWIGFGLWAQLCASWFLPLAWAWSWRAVRERRYVFRATIYVALTAALHFESGYLAFGALALFPFLIPSQLLSRIKNALLVIAASLVATCWVTIPLLLNARWAAINTAIAPTGLARGYGARANLGWLFSGQLFDAGRFPIISICFGLGVIAVVVRWRRNAIGRALLGLFVLFFLISWGPTTWGSLISILPGHADIYFRRFQMGTSMAGIYLAGVGLAWVASLVVLGLRHVIEREPPEASAVPRLGWLSRWLPLGLAVAATLVAIPSLLTIDQANAQLIGTQRVEQARLAKDIDPMLDLIKQANNGRVYAGLPSNWGANFTVGEVPVFEYLTAEDVQGVGFTLRTASLMSQPEAQFDEFNLSDYEIYGVRYLILPTSMTPPVPAVSVESAGPYHLWALPKISFLSIVVPSGSIHENKGTLATQAPEIQNTGYFDHHLDFSVVYPSSSLGVRYPSINLTSSPGSILSEDADLVHGTASGRVSLNRPANVVLSASFDPGWTATVDGHPVATQMLAPALVSVPVPAGVHEVSFSYEGFSWYPELFVVALLGLWASYVVARRARRRAAAAPSLDAGDGVRSGARLPGEGRP